ncbi:hypothetical protein BA011_06145 [Rhizobium leguminosarum]|uniref:Uncharacterized protein n=1 Tax=Rhizobium leguminosarum TaxID=384 RepID=A0A1B1C6I4_RHILE|nr:hypothetical protein BA011_06145 [Rhizobium leguminosarum]
MERHGDFLRADETIQPVTGSELDFDVFRSFWQGIVSGSTAISCVAEDETITARAFPQILPWNLLERSQ